MFRGSSRQLIHRGRVFYSLMSSFEAEQFKFKLAKGIDTVTRVLDVNRNVIAVDDCLHSYDDKYLLVEKLTSTSLAAILNALQSIGFDEKVLEQIMKLSKNSTATLRFKQDSECTFDKEEIKEIEGTSLESTSLLGLGKTTCKTITKQKEYFWKFKSNYEILIYFGTDLENPIILKTNNLSTILKTTSKDSPQPNKHSHPPVDISLTWLLKQLNDVNSVTCSIDRIKKNCHTPRRNPLVEDAVEFLTKMKQWGWVVSSQIARLISVEQNNSPDESLMSEELFIPILPIFEQQPDNEDSVMLSQQDYNLLLQEQQRALTERISNIEKSFPTTGLATAVEGVLKVVVAHIMSLCGQFIEGVNFIEKILQKQLIDAVGKEISATDFGRYMTFHMRGIFLKKFIPETFSYAVRHHEHNPEGVVNFELVSQELEEQDTPVLSIVRKMETSIMSFPLSASSVISFSGSTFIHSIINHRFSHECNEFNLVARARQFSGYILVLGTISGDDTFIPTNAIIIKNKDDLSIPLLLNEIPTPKQFRNAIESLSPEQQQFAKAYRSMQLQSTLFGMCVIQIKPQLERVLNLPEDSLTKEIKLTQDIIDMFLTYQLSSDLLSFTCDPVDLQNMTTVDKINQVKEHVNNMKEMIKNSKENEIEEETMKAEAAKQKKLQKEQPEPEIKSAFSGMPPEGRPPVRTGCIREDLEGLQEMTEPIPLRRPLPQEPEPEPEQDQFLSTSSCSADITGIPQLLESKFDLLDSDDSLRPTIIKTGAVWKKSTQNGLLSKKEDKIISGDELKQEKNTAFDLLDSLTRSGAMCIPDVELHVVIASTHCFDKTLMETVIQGNINPIEKVERSILIAASVIHSVPTSKLVVSDHVDRVKGHSPQLFNVPQIRKKNTKK